MLQSLLICTYFWVEKLHLYVENWQSCLHSTWFYDELLSSDAAPSWWRVWCQHGKTSKLSVEKFTNKHFNLLFHTKTNKCLLFQLPLVRPHLFLSANLNWTCGHLARPHSALSSLCSQPLHLSSAPRLSFLIRHLQCCAMAGRGGAQRTNGTAASSKICQFKLVLLGESAVGKSSLVLRFVKGQFHEYQESTIGGERRWSPRDDCAKLIQRSHVLPILTPLIFRKRWLLASGRGGGWFAVPSICLEVGLWRWSRHPNGGIVTNLAISALSDIKKWFPLRTCPYWPLFVSLNCRRLSELVKEERRQNQFPAADRNTLDATD